MSWDKVDNYLAEGGVTGASEVEVHLMKISASSGKAGEAYLMQAMSDLDLRICCLLKATLLLAMTPFITFGVGSETVPSPADFEEAEGEWDDGTVNLLRDLASRHLTGHNARDAIYGEFTRLNSRSRSLLYRVLVKEMRIGYGPTTVNKYHKGLIPVFAHKGAKRTKEALHKVKWPCFAEYKFDGWRSVIKTDGVAQQSFSRNGLPMPNMDYRAEDLRALTELLVRDKILPPGQWAWDGEGKAEGHFNATSSEARKAGKGEDLTYHIFDLLPWDQMSGGFEPIEKRYARLDEVQAYLNSWKVRGNPELARLKIVDRFELDEEADAWELYSQARELGHEGLILKQRGSFYTPGKTIEWVKVKPEETVDLVCTGTFLGDKGSKLEGRMAGVIVDHGGVAVRVGNITNKQRDEWEADPSLVIKSVLEILYHEVTPDGSLREPRLAKDPIRKDKYPEEADKVAV